MSERRTHTPGGLIPKVGDVLEGENYTIHLHGTLARTPNSGIFTASASSTRKERLVAAKIPSDTDYDGEKYPDEVFDYMIDAARREADIHQTLSDHPKVLPVTLVEDIQINGREIPVLGTMVANKNTLTSRLPVMSFPDRVDVLAEVAEALTYAHDKNIIHGDVKPSNVFCHVFNHHEGEVSLLGDWGSAAYQEAPPANSFITPEFTAPERWKGIIGPGNDVYSLGITAYNLLTLYDAFPFSMMADYIFAMHIHQLRSPERFSMLKGIHPDAYLFEELILAALEKDPLNRPSMNEFTQTLRAKEGDLSDDHAINGWSIPLPVLQTKS